MDAHSRQRGQPPRRHSSALWRYGRGTKPEGAVTFGPLGRTAKIALVGRSKAQQIQPDYCNNQEYDLLPEGEQVKHILHVARYVASSN